MSIFEKRNKPEEKKVSVTKEPNLDELAIWYGLTPRGFRKRRNAKNVGVKSRILTEKELGEIFYKCGIPSKLPAELHEWARL